MMRWAPRQRLYEANALPGAHATATHTRPRRTRDRDAHATARHTRPRGTRDRDAHATATHTRPRGTRDGDAHATRRRRTRDREAHATATHTPPRRTRDAHATPTDTATATVDRVHRVCIRLITRERLLNRRVGTLLLEAIIEQKGPRALAVAACSIPGVEPRRSIVDSPDGDSGALGLFYASRYDVVVHRSHGGVVDTVATIDIQLAHVNLEPQRGQALDILFDRSHGRRRVRRPDMCLHADPVDRNATLFHT